MRAPASTVEQPRQQAKAADVQGVRPVAATFHNILGVVFLIFVFAVVQMFTLWRVCKAGMATAASLEHQGLPTLNELASLQEHLAIYRLDSYECLFAREDEKVAKEKAVEAMTAQTQADFETIKRLLPEGEARRLASNLENAFDDLNIQFRRVRSLVDSDFAAAMRGMDQDIPARIGRMAAAANALKDYGYRFSGSQAYATFGSFSTIKRNAIMFGAGNIIVAFGAVMFVLLAARRSQAQLSETLARLADTHKLLLDSSRQAGMAEVATGVLHNVGNVLNSVNVSASVVVNRVRHTKAAGIKKLAALIDEHKEDLAGFLTTDSRGRMVPSYLTTLSDSLAAEHKTVINELENLQKNVEHIKEIVAMQQSYARISGFIETVPVLDVVEDALRISGDSLARHGVAVFRNFQTRPSVTTDRHKVTQILVNFISNAMHACDDSGQGDKRVTIRTTSDEKGVRIAVIDNGVGIPEENLTRIFQHGFTTRKDGHGFGLHSSAIAARELGGSLGVESGGAGKGAAFVLELPYEPEPPAGDSPAA